MKKVVSALVILISLASCQNQQKIAYIDNGKVINGYQMKIDIEDEFKKKDELYQKKTDSIGKSYQMDAQQTQLKLSKLSEKEKQEGSQQFSQKWQMVQQQLQYEQQQMQQSFNQEMDSVVVKVKEFVNNYGKENGYTYILGKNEAGSVMFGKEENDISEEITKALNDAYNTKSETIVEDKVKEEEVSEE